MGRLAPWGHTVKVPLLSRSSISPNRAQIVQNGPGNGTRPWVPKAREKCETGGGLRPKTLRKGGVARPSPLPKRKSHERSEKRRKKPDPLAAPRHPAEEEGTTTSTRLLVMLRHHRKLGDAPTYKTHQGNGERVKRREKWGRRTEGEGTHRQWGFSHGNGGRR